jgi:hypothetical protein
MWGNCVLYAVLQYRRQVRHWRAAGSPPGMEPRLVIRPSRMAPDPVPTVSLAMPLDETGTRLHYAKFQPVDTRPLRWWQVWRVCCFKGRVVQGDDAPTHTPTKPV